MQSAIVIKGRQAGQRGGLFAAERAQFRQPNKDGRGGLTHTGAGGVQRFVDAVVLKQLFLSNPNYG